MRGLYVEAVALQHQLHLWAGGGQGGRECVGRGEGGCEQGRQQAGGGGREGKERRPVPPRARFALPRARLAIVLGGGSDELYDLLWQIVLGQPIQALCRRQGVWAVGGWGGRGGGVSGGVVRRRARLRRGASPPRPPCLDDGISLQANGHGGVEGVGRERVLVDDLMKRAGVCLGWGGGGGGMRGTACTGRAHAAPKCTQAGSPGPCSLAALALAPSQPRPAPLGATPAQRRQ